MKRILGLVISPRRLGNSEILVKEIMRNIPFACNPELIRLTDMKIDPCTACYRCLEQDSGCARKDDFNFIMDRIILADAVIIGVPVYLLGPHGCYKMLNDRLVAGFRYLPYTAGKPCIVVVPHGAQNWEGYSKAAALVLPRLLQMKIIDYWPVEATLPGESLMNDANLAYAQVLGKRLFDNKPYVPGPRECPYCGSDLFRLLPDNKIECPICGIEGFLEMDGLPTFPLNQDFRFSSHKIIEHFDGWVRDMKKSFQEKKPALKELQQAYVDLNWWVKP